MAREFAKQFYHSKVWKKTREYILMRDKFLCVRCGSPLDLEVHHIIRLTPSNINNVEVSLNPENLITLCRDCHQREHKQERADGHRAKPYEDVLTEYVFDENGMIIPKD